MNTRTAEQKKTVLCADIGTSSLKTALIDESGTVLAYVREKFDYTNPADMWLNALSLSVQEIRQKVSFDNLCAFSISGNGPTFGALYPSTHTDIVLWNDPRFNHFNSYKGRSLFLPRMLSYLDSSKHMEKPVSFLSGPEYLVWQLCGDKTTLLPEKRYLSAYWTKEDLQEYNLNESLFPPYILLGEKSGTLLPSAAEAMGIYDNLTSIPVFCAGPDFTSALIGTNTLTPGTICDRAGSSEGFNLCTENPLLSNNIRNLPSVIYPLMNASIMIPDSGIRFSNVKKTTAFASSSYEDYVSFLLHNRREKGYKQMIELAQECERALSTLLLAYNKKIERRVTVTGGQARNSLWLQVKANIMDAAIDIPSCSDAELIGNAAVAFYGLNFYPDLTSSASSLFSIKKTFYPDGAFYSL